MRWNQKTDIIALLIAWCIFPLIALVAGLLVPIIVSVKDNGIWVLWPIPALAFIIGFLIYFSIRRRKRNKKM